VIPYLTPEAGKYPTSATSVKMILIEELTISQVHSAFKDGTYTSRELTEAFLARIAAIDKAGPKLNSLNAIATTALDEASALDAHFTATSQFFGTLRGIPVIVKDQVETKGIATTYGSIIAKDHVTEKDASVVRKLKEAGAIVLAKSTMPGMSFKSVKSLSFWLIDNRLGNRMVLHVLTVRHD
jgi:amidase